MFCCTLLYVNSSIAIILMGMRELVALLDLSSWCLVMAEWLFLAVPWGCLRFVIVVFPYHTLLLFLQKPSNNAYIQLKVDEYADLELDVCTTWISPDASLIKYDDAYPICDQYHSCTLGKDIGGQKNDSCTPDKDI